MNKKEKRRGVKKEMNRCSNCNTQQKINIYDLWLRFKPGQPFHLESVLCNACYELFLHYMTMNKLNLKVKLIAKFKEIIDIKDLKLIDHAY